MVGNPHGELADQPVAAVGRGEGAHERDADLHGRQEPVGVGREIEGRLSLAVALLGQRPETATTAGDDGHLRPGEESVGEDQREDDQEFLEHGRSGDSLRSMTARLSRCTTSS